MRVCLKAGFMNLKIKAKTVLCMVALALVIALAVGIFCSYSYMRQFTAQSNRQTENTLDVTVFSLRENLNALYRSATYLLSNPLFQRIYQTAAHGAQNPDFLKEYASVQPLFESFLQANELVDNVALLCENEQIYSTYEVGLNYTAENFSQELQQTSIAWLPEQKNPLMGTNARVVPVCLPIAYTPMRSFTDGHMARMVLVVYLNADRLALSMEQMNRVAFSRGYLANAQGFPLTVQEGDALYASLSKPAFCDAIAAQTTRNSFTQDIGGESYGITTEPVGISGLRFVSVMSYQPLLSGVQEIWKAALIAVVSSFIVAMLLAHVLATTLTSPIRRLIEQVKKVRAGNYALQPFTKYNDEMHEMDEALCAMSHTIRMQMNNITEKENMRRKAEMEALTEQMNPHFLYNTLDCIHWEILGGHQQNAAVMVENLGAFLRLSLNHGCEFLTLAESLQHTEQYLNIMNCRMETRIRFTYTFPTELADFRLPKMILQPLAENSILHGFDGLEQGASLASPCIAVRVRQDATGIFIEFEDNGSGIDCVRAGESVCSSPEGHRHIGLYNVYHRLVYCFGETTKITFSSIPYYKNTVTVFLPGCVQKIEKE